MIWHLRRVICLCDWRQHSRPDTAVRNLVLSDVVSLLLHVFNDMLPRIEISRLPQWRESIATTSFVHKIIGRVWFRCSKKIGSRHCAEIKSKFVLIQIAMPRSTFRAYWVCRGVTRMEICERKISIVPWCQSSIVMSPTSTCKSPW